MKHVERGIEKLSYLTKKRKSLGGKVDILEIGNVTIMYWDSSPFALSHTMFVAHRSKKPWWEGSCTEKEFELKSVKGTAFTAF